MKLLRLKGEVKAADFIEFYVPLEPSNARAAIALIEGWENELKDLTKALVTLEGRLNSFVCKLYGLRKEHIKTLNESLADFSSP